MYCVENLTSSVNSEDPDQKAAHDLSELLRKMEMSFT